MRKNATGRLISLSAAAVIAALFLVFATAYIVAGPFGAAAATAFVGLNAWAIRSTLPGRPPRN